MELDALIEFDTNEMVSWKGSKWANDVVDSTLAHSRSPFFPNSHDAFSEVKKLANSGKYKTGWTNEITGYVEVPKLEIIGIIKNLYCNINHIDNRFDDLLAFVQSLPEDKTYKLFHQEF
jgi:hypothetical protein